jgi:quercetin dioxygenase-like cupin family protein
VIGRREDVGLAVGLGQIDSSDVGIGEGKLRRRAVCGRLFSLSHSEFEPGYRSTPHAHEGEEVAEVIDGTISIYMNGCEYRLERGDFVRIPAMCVHWKVNRSSGRAVMFESHSPPVGGVSRSLLSQAEREDGAFGSANPVETGRTYLASQYYAEGEATFPPAAESDPLLVRRDVIWGRPTPQYGMVDVSEGRVEIASVAGETLSFMHIVRTGLRARPHFHAAEQISYVAAGRLWTFVDGRAFLSEAGDFIRVPGNVVHWAVVPPGEEAVTLEVHSPLQGDPVVTPRHYLVPDHRISSLRWIPSGMATAAPDTAGLAEYEAHLMAAELERIRLEAGSEAAAPLSAVAE